MLTFSISVGDYEGFLFRVNPVDTSIVEFYYQEGDDTVIAEFKRNGVLIAVTRVPTLRLDDVVRNTADGRPVVLTPEQLEAKDQEERNHEDAAYNVASPINQPGERGVRSFDPGTRDYVSERPVV